MTTYASIVNQFAYNCSYDMTLASILVAVGVLQFFCSTLAIIDWQ